MVNNKIQIAFCFDMNMFGPACVSIASLLDSKGTEDHFAIHCIVDDASLKQKGVLTDIVEKRDAGSSIMFHPAPNIFESSFETRGISKATYMRFAIHNLIPDIDKIIYSDVDVLFCDSLKELWETDIDDYYFAGVKGTNNFANKWEDYAGLDYFEELDGIQGKYINAGILVMNLRRIRETGIDTLWIEKSRMSYKYQDQDIINITCKDQILHLPLKYNLAGYLIPKWFKKYYVQGIYSKKECMEAYRHPVILHYAGDKPWKARDAHRADMWWDYVLAHDDLATMFPYMKKNCIYRIIKKIKHFLKND